MEAKGYAPSQALPTAQPGTTCICSDLVTVQCSVPGQLALPIRGQRYGRARLTLTFDDDRQSQAVAHYFVLPPMQEHVQCFGAFQASKAWFQAGPYNETDPFGRAPSVMPWDREAERHVLHDPR